jgi:hypothetical protein
MGDQLPDWFSHPVIAIVLFLALPANAALFSGASTVSLHSGIYWLLKLGYIYLGLAIGIGLTTLWECKSQEIRASLLTNCVRLLGRILDCIFLF